MKSLAIATAALGLIMTTSPALADPQERVSQNVSIAGIDLDTAEGQRMLEQRIDRAAREVCRVNHINTGTRIPSHAARECAAKARGSARQQVAAIIENQRRGG
ncbi:UrcA family protein [Qipengyuania sp. ASV99]|uniref:UrcA family protein n=1 Tax=Qipengyuania sp. ASV99 TaxID=3399681 RepID=UPI003A4C68E8